MKAPEGLQDNHLRYLTTFVSAVKTLFQSWQDYHEMNREFPHMARKANSLPSYLLHKPTGQARIRISGKDHYLGPFGSEGFRIAYGKLIAAMAGGTPIDRVCGFETW